MAFFKVGKTDDVRPGQAKMFEVEGRAIAVCNVGGEYYAVDNTCTHAEGPLGYGELEGHEIECPHHGARFDVRSGDVTASPAVLPIDTFKIRIQGEDIEVEV